MGLAACEGGCDAHFVAVGDGCVQAVEEADVFAVHVDEDEAADFTGFVEDAILHAGECAFEVGEDIRFLDGLNTPVADRDEVSITPALAGG